MTVGKTDTKVIILAGGLGTRSENPNLPKILQEVAPGFTLLDNWINRLAELGFKDVSIIGGHGFELLRTHVRKLDSDLTINLIRDQALIGTLGALQVAPLDGAGSALVVSGDTFSTLNYSHYLGSWLTNPSDIGVMVHRNGHPKDSDTLEISGSAIRGFRKKGQEFSLKLETFALTGAFFAKLSVLRELRQLGSPADIMEAVFTLSHKRISPIPVVGASMDTGTPDRLIRAREALAFQRTQGPQVAILDRDGTILSDEPNGRKGLTEGEILAEDARAIGYLNRVGVPVFLLTNQPAVAKGWITPVHVDGVHLQILSELSKFEAWIDEFAVCFHHPESGHEGEVASLKVDCACRKPEAGMALKLIDKHGLQNHKFRVLGDTDADAGLAAKLGGSFTQVNYSTGPNLSEALEEIRR